MLSFNLIILFRDRPGSNNDPKVIVVRMRSFDVPASTAYLFDECKLNINGSP